MTDKELYLLTHPDEWPYGNKLPVIRRGGDPVRNRKDAGIIRRDNICRVWSDMYIGDVEGEFFGSGIPMDYSSPEALLKEWEID